MFANPDSTFTDVITAAPARVRAPNGWVPVDTSLRIGADGLVRPGATVVDIAFSAGGSGPLVRLSDEGRSLSLGWPTALPAPVLSGDTATYAEVLPGVDLKVRAQADRFSEVLVVKSAAAAANPALASVRLSVSTTGMSVQADGAGGLTVLDSAGAKVFSALPPSMWDSTMPAAAPNALDPADPGMVSTDHGPGYGARRATMPVTVTPNSLTISPDRTVLTGSGTAYPVFVDPAFGRYARTAWTEVDQQHPTWTGAIVEGDLAAAGYQNFEPPLTIRTFFHYNLSATVWGFHILDAKLKAHLVWSASHDPSCHYSTPIQSWVTGAFTASTNWNNQPAWSTHLGDMNIIGGNPANPGCPATDVEFNVTTGVAAAARDRKGINIGIKASNESDPVAWRKFSNNPELDITYNHPPNTPAATAMRTVNPNASCVNTSVASPAHLNVTAHNGVTFRLDAATDKDPNEQLTVRFELWRYGGSGALASTGPDVAHKQNSGTAFTWSVANNSTNFPNPTFTYAWKALVYDVHPTTGALMDHAAAWSPLCYFVLDTAAPDEPTISSTDFPSADYGKHAGQQGAITITPPAGITDLAGFQTAVDQAAPTFHSATGALTLPVTVATSGPHQLSVKTQDSAGNLSTAAVYGFYAGSPIDAAATWRLNEGAGSTVDSLDESGSGQAMPQGTLNSGVTWSTDSRFGAVPQFDGTAGAISTTLTSLHTNAGFSITAWVKLTDKTKRYVIASEDGNSASGFALEYAPAPTDKWRFVMTSADANTNTVLAAASVTAPAVGVWTHLAGVFNASTHTMTLFVNGGLHHNQVNNAPWDAAGHPVVLGRGRNAGTATGFLAGQLSEVRVYARALSYDSGLGAGEVSDIVNHSNAENPTALWHLDGNGADLVGGHLLTPASGTSYVPGHAGSALRLDGTDQGYATTTAAVITTDRSFTFSTWVNLDNADDGYTVLSQDAETGSGVSLRFDADLDKWVFSMTGLTTDGTPAEQSVGVPAHHRAGVWVHLTAVYDSFSHLLWMYTSDPSPGGFGVESAHVQLGVPAISTGAFQAGRELFLDPDTQAASYVGVLPGSVDEVGTWLGTIPAGRIS